MKNSFGPSLDRIPTTLSTLTTGESCSSVGNFSVIKRVVQISLLTRAIAYQGLFTAR